MKGWYGNKERHSLASKGIRTKNSMKALGLSGDEKWNYNYDKLRGSYSNYFIYVPIQYGNLSNDKRGVKHIDTAIIKDEHGLLGRALVLQINNEFVGAGRKWIWYEKREEEPREDGTYWWNYGFKPYRKGSWDAYKQESAKNREEMGDKWWK